MSIETSRRDRLIAKLGREAPDVSPDLLARLVDEVAEQLQQPAERGATVAPFAVPWMDSFVAHWVLGQEVAPVPDRGAEVAEVLRALVDAAFETRRRELLEWVRGLQAGPEPPDGGPPEPGVPPTGPDGPEPPDGGPPEPGVPPTGPELLIPDAGPPEPGVPPTGPDFLEPPDGGPPEPGVPPTGPEVPPTGPEPGISVENPWILYWFLSVKAPSLLDVVEAHLTRRLDELGFRPR